MLADRAGEGETGTKSGFRDVGYLEVRNRFRLSEMGRVLTVNGLPLASRAIGRDFQTLCVVFNVQ